MGGVLHICFGFWVSLCSGCSAHALPFYRCLGETTRVSYSACLTIWVTHAPSTGVRTTTVLSFPQPSPLLWGTNVLDSFHDFSRQISSLCVLCSIMETCSFTLPSIGGWGRRKAGDWGRKPGRGRGIAAGLPPFPRVVSPSSGKTVLRIPSTQSIKNKSASKWSRTYLPWGSVYAVLRFRSCSHSCCPTGRMPHSSRIHTPNRPEWSNPRLCMPHATSSVPAPPA